MASGQHKTNKQTQFPRFWLKNEGAFEKQSQSAGGVTGNRQLFDNSLDPARTVGNGFKQSQFGPDVAGRARIGPAIISHGASKACCIGGPANGMLSSMAKYPVFLELGGRRVVLIGGGSVAVRKAQALLEAGARLVVVAERAGNNNLIPYFYIL